MALKSPAFRFYPESWWMGTLGMLPVERACYLDLLCLQWESGGFSLGYALGSARGIPEDVLQKVLAIKFVLGEDGLYRNERLEIERVKQVEYTEKQRKNGKLGGRPPGTKNPTVKPSHNPEETQRLSQTQTQTKPKQKPSVSVSVSSSVSEEDQLHTPPVPTPSLREAKKLSGKNGAGKEFPTGEQNPIPEPLRTPEFLSAWQRWLDFRLAADGRLNPVQQELQLKTCLERGPAKAARDLEASILGGSKGQIFDSDRSFGDKPVDPNEPVGDEKTNPKRYTPADFLHCWGHYFEKTDPPRMTPGRAKAIAYKLRDPWFVENFPAAVEKASKTDVFNGKGNWKADVDWFLKGDNAVRVWEGTFDKKNPYAGFPGMPS